MELDDLLRGMVEKGASDLHLKPGRPPMFRVDGLLKPISNEALSPEATVALAAHMMDEKQRADFSTKNEIDLAYSVPKTGRFRTNVFRQRGSVEIIMRLIPMKIPELDEIHVPEVLKKLAMEPRGLLLVTGMTGSGKTTTITAILDYINQKKHVHIVTVEDPIEFLHQDKQASFTQREIGIDTDDFKTALRYVLRQDPDVILIGEMRDVETVSAALTAAETGHLVISTLHTINAVKTIDRILDFFPGNQQDQIRGQLANSLVGVVSQRLLRTAKGSGRVPACEIMIVNQTISSLIEEGKINQLKQHIEEGGAQYGMQTFDQSLVELCKENLITREEAMKEATSPNEIDLALKGITSSRASARSVLDFMEDEKAEEEMIENLSKARRMVAARRWEDAHKVLGKVLHHSPGHKEAQTLLAKVKKQFSAADLTDKAKPLVQEGMKLMRTGVLDKALAQFHKALEIDPGNKMILSYISGIDDKKQAVGKSAGLLKEASAAMAQEKWPKAQILLSDVLKVDPGNAEAKASLKQISDRLAKADTDRKAAEFNKKATAHFNNGELMEALRLWNRALAHKSDWQELRQYMGTVRTRLSQQGIPDVAKEVPKFADVQGLYKAGCDAFESGDFRVAEASFSSAANKSGVKKGGNSFLEKRTAIAKKWGENYITEISQEAGREASSGALGSARRRMEDLLRLYPNHGASKKQLGQIIGAVQAESERIYKEGILNMENRKNEAAIQNFEAMLEMDPASARAKQKLEEAKANVKKLQDILAKID